MAAQQFKIKGMTCSSCANAIESTALKLKGIKAAEVSFATETGRFDVDGDESLQNLKNQVHRLGYSIESLSASEPITAGLNAEEASWEKKKLFVVGMLALLIFALEMGPLMHWPSHQTNYWLQALLALPVILWPGLRFWRGLKSLFFGHPNMDSLVGLGILASLLPSMLTLLWGNRVNEWGLESQVYFEGIVFIIFFIGLGHFLEAQAKAKTFDAIESLARLNATSVRLITMSGEEIVSPKQLKAGDKIVVYPGEKIAADGEIIKGDSSIDESMMTGEPLRVSKKIGDAVIAGTINGDGILQVEVRGVGEETFLAQIMRSVLEAQHQKPKLQRLADRVGRWFVPFILVLALITFVVWFIFGPEPKLGHALGSLVAVLVIACPCALGLATPMAVSVASGEAGRLGLMIKGGETFEKAKTISMVAFDKTGTLSEGRPSVNEIFFHADTQSQNGQEKILSILQTMASFSGHPLAKAAAAFVAAKNVPPVELDSFENVPGRGLRASIQDQTWYLGSLSFLQENNVSVAGLPNNIDSTVNIILGSAGHSWSTALTFEDKIKPEAHSLLQLLKERSIKTILLSGDNQKVVDGVCRELDLFKGVGRLLPHNKKSIIEEYQKSGEKVAFVGDGINDAPALQQSDLSFAVAQGSDVAQAAADVIILRGDLFKVVEFLNLSKGTVTIMQQNLFWAFAYNVACIPLAAGILYPVWGIKLPPVLASMAMAMSSLTVVFNAFRLKRRAS